MHTEQATYDIIDFIPHAVDQKWSIKGATAECKELMRRQGSKQYDSEISAVMTVVVQQCANGLNTECAILATKIMLNLFKGA